jgi:ATP-binding cassette, subfamily F, member 3
MDGFAMLGLEGISLQFGEKTLFDEVSVRVNARDRIGLVGANGAGKTTLFRIIMGEIEPEAGNVDKAGYVTIGYLPQETLTMPGRSVFDEAASAFEDVNELKRRLDEADTRLATLSYGDAAYNDTLDAIGEIEHRLGDLEADKMKSRVEKVLLGLGFSMSDMERDCGEFSGGWQMRIALARLLLKEPSLLLLDEPTNHLDLDSLRWLEKYLQSYEGAIILISHDRAFLDALCTRIFALTHSRIDAYTGNYSSFEEQAAARYEQALQAQKSQERKLAQVERFIERFRYKASKASQVQSRIKALNKVERIEVDENEASMRGFNFPPPERCVADVMRLKGLVKRYGDHTVLNNVDLDISRGDRIAVVGVNGAGKSTLSRVLAGVEGYEGGDLKIGDRVKVAYFAQHQASQLNPEKTVLEVASDGIAEKMQGRVRSILGSFLFCGDDVYKPVKVLSGGEKNRLALAHILLCPTNFLILDEPTNHLDMASKDMLREALIQWDGTMVIVSHDRDFLDKLVTRVVEVQPGKVRVFPGNLSFYIEKIDAERAALGAAGESSSAQKSNQNPKERRRVRAELIKQIAPLKKEAERLESLIAEKEHFISETETAMMDPAFFKSGAAPDLLRKVEQYRKEIDADMSKWERYQRDVTKKEAEMETLDE